MLMPLPFSISLQSRVALLLAALALVAVVSGCRRGTEEPEATPTAETTAMDPPMLLVSEPTVQFRATESDALEDLASGAQLEIEPGANVVVGPVGRASISWQGFLANELVAGADTLLSLSLPEERRAILDQAAGTARYTVSDSEEPTDLQVIAGWITIAVTEAPADFIVSFIPSDDPTAWVTMLEGSARIVGPDGVDLGTIEDGEAGAWPQSLESMDSDAPVVPGEDGLPRLLTVDKSRVQAWYSELATGKAQSSIAAVAFRCVVTARQAVIRDAPDDEAEEAGNALSEGTVVEVLARSDDDQWLQITPLTATGLAWIAVDDVSCNGPLASAPMVADPDDPPTPTPQPLPTRGPVLILPTPTPGPSATPVPSVTPDAAATISFSANVTEITAGECATLSWEVSNIVSVYLNGEGVTGSGTRRVCPTADTTYTLTVNLIGDGDDSRAVTIRVRQAAATHTPRPTATPQPQPTDPPPAPTDPPPPTPTFVPTAPPNPTATEEPAPTVDPFKASVTR